LEGDDQEFELLPHTSAILVSEWPISLISLLDLDRLCSTRQTSTFTPLIFSGIFYASNGRYKISYIDSLFNCVSAMTVCGLATINLSSLTGFQQALLFFLMCIGNPVIVSWVIVYMRRSAPFIIIIKRLSITRSRLLQILFRKEI
jgi:hypothetical protein